MYWLFHAVRKKSRFHITRYYTNCFNNITKQKTELLSVFLDPSPQGVVKDVRTFFVDNEECNYVLKLKIIDNA